MANGSTGPAAPTIRSSLGRSIGLWLILGLPAAFWLFAIATGVQWVSPVALWGIAALAYFVLLGWAGREINGQWFGILIDTRNKLSLARLQITFWTIMVLTAFLTIALIRVRRTLDPGASITPQQALDIKFPPELLLAMGISAASFAGSSLIKSNKTTRQLAIEARATPEAAKDRHDKAQTTFRKAENALALAVQEDVSTSQALEAANTALAAARSDSNLKGKQEEAETRRKLAAASLDAAKKDRDAAKRAQEEAEADLKAITEAQGLLHKNADPSEARWVDLFRGEEIGNYKLVDMSKVQMLLITVAVVAAYAATISVLLRDPELGTKAALSFPDFNDTLNGLLGISHGTYLSVKAVNHS